VKIVDCPIGKSAAMNWMVSGWTTHSRAFFDDVRRMCCVRTVLAARNRTLMGRNTSLPHKKSSVDTPPIFTVGVFIFVDVKPRGCHTPSPLNVLIPYLNSTIMLVALSPLRQSYK